MPFQMNAPLHEQVRWDLLQRIRRGEFQPGALIPNEAQLCDQYGVSRITIRRAIGDLCADEFLYRKHGVGTFVTDAVSSAQSIRLRGSLADILAEDPRILFEVVGVHDEPADAATVEIMESHAPIARLDLRVTLDGQPFALAQLHLPAASVNQALAREMNGTKQPILVFAEHTQCTLAAAEQAIYAGTVTSTAAEALSLAEGSAILQMRRTYFDVNGETVGVVVGHFHPERIEITVKLQLAAMDGPRVNRARQKVAT